MKHVSQLDPDGYFVGATVADESPLEPGVFLMPAGALDVAPPVIPDNHVARWVGEWVFEAVERVEPEPEPEATEPTYAEKRRREYPPAADYLDAVVKGDQAQIDAYIAACLAVKAKYPKPPQ